MEDIRIIKNSKKSLDFTGKTITNNNLGNGIVVGYSSRTGEPFVFFYKTQTVLCINHNEITLEK